MRRLFIVSMISAAAWAAGCEQSFSKSGNPLTGTKYNAVVTVQGVTVADAVGQLHDIAVEKNLDILTEDAATGAMLLEDRASFKQRAIPYVVSVSADGEAATIQMMVKLNKGAFAKADAVQKEICAMLDKVTRGGGGKGLTQVQGPRKVDALTLSMQLARENEESPESIPLRYKERSFTVSGKVKYVIKDGSVYRVAFDIPEKRDMALGNFPGMPSYMINISCLMAPSQAAWALALRPGEKIKLTGAYSDYDQFKRVMWLGDCKAESR
jgi:hypothetical protein